MLPGEEIALVAGGGYFLRLALPERHAAALYAPPSHRKFLLQTAHFWERLGRRFEPRVIAGALLVEASKQVYARPPVSGSRVAVPGPFQGTVDIAAHR